MNEDYQLEPSSASRQNLLCDQFAFTISILSECFTIDPSPSFDFNVPMNAGKRLRGYSSSILNPQEIPKPKTLFETYTSKQARGAVSFLLIMSVIGFLMSVCFTVLSATTFKSQVKVLTSENTSRTYDIYEPSSGFYYFEVAIWSVLTFVLLVALGTFTIHYFKKTTESIPEQIQMYALVFGTIVYTTPFFPFYLIHYQVTPLSVAIGTINGSFSPEEVSFTTYVAIASSLEYFGFLIVILIYVISTIRSHRYLKYTIHIRDNIRRTGSLVYLIGLYVVVRVISIVGPMVIFGSSLFTTLLVSIRYQVNGVDLRWTWAFMCALQITDIIFFMWIAAEIKKTRQVLVSKSYIKYRHKQLGHRLFIFETSIMFFFQLISEVLMVSVVPIGGEIMLFTSTGNLAMNLHFCRAGINVGLVSYVLLRLHGNLPADIPGIFHFTVRRNSAGIVENNAAMFQLTALDFRDEHGRLVLVDKSFCFETQVLMLNYSYLVYKLFLPEKENFFPQRFGDDEHEIVQMIQEDVFDTHAIIVASETRIIVAFRGTVSLKNIESDINFTSTKLSLVYSELSQNIIEWNRAKVHKGFADSYFSVRDDIERIVHDLFNEKQRIVYICGHSLGGALATLFSFGLSLRHHEIRNYGISVTTFGQPRVGNQWFKMLFDEYVPIYWRLVNTGDMITKIPGKPYKHVGDLALLTKDSEIFIDPSFSDKVAWHKSRQEMATHRLGTYYLSLKHYIEYHHGTAVRDLVGFWQWDLDAQVTQMYEHNLMKRRSTMGCDPESMSRGVFLWRRLMFKILIRDTV